LRSGQRCPTKRVGDYGRCRVFDIKRRIPRNREYERLYHVRREQIRGKTDFDIHPRHVAEAVRANDRKVIEAGAPIQFEEAVPSDEGERYYVAGVGNSSQPS
jgi:PAS domain-containing protein